MTKIIFSISAMLLAGLWFVNATSGASSGPSVSATTGKDSSNTYTTAIFAGGCFWCVEADYEKLTGVISAKSGYTGGFTKNPTYKEVSRDNTGHYEAVEITYDASITSYRDLVGFFFRHVDPLDEGGQFCDRGQSYRTAIFVLGPQEREAAEAAKKEAEAILGKSIVTPILERVIFYDAEEYHQDYYKKKPLPYKYYRTSCGRDRRIKAIWGDRK